MATVLLTTDGSDRATAAMARGLELLGRDHRFLALAVVPPAAPPSATVGPMDTHPLVLDPTLEAEVERRDREACADELAQLDRALGIEAEPIIELGDAGSTICEVAGRTGADVIVVGSHGHGWLQRALIGSVSTHVLHHAPCPVLVVRLDHGAP